MLLGFDAKRLFLNDTGLGNYSRSLVQGIEAAFPEHQYTLFTPRIRHNSATEPFTKPPFRVVEPKHSFGGYWRSLGIYKDLKNAEIDLFHGLSHEIPLHIPTNTRSVVTIHDLIWQRFPQMYGVWDRHIHDLKCRYACRNADQIIAISESTKNDIIQFYGIEPAKIEVIYQTCNPIFYNFNNKNVENKENSSNKIPNTPYLLYVGSIIERKNLLNLLKALLLLPKNTRDTPLYIVGGGKGSYFEQIQHFIRENGLVQQIVFLKNVSDTQLADLYRHAAAFIYPSVYEGFGIPIIEALFSGAPVITSTQKALTEAAGDGSMCIDVTKPALIAEAINHILNDQTTVEKMRTEGKLYAERFLPQGLATQLMRSYERIL